MILTLALLLLSFSSAYAASGGGGPGGGGGSGTGTNAGGKGITKEGWISNLICDASTNCTFKNTFCFVLPGIGPRCADPDPCNYSCSQGQKCEVLNTSPPEVKCKTPEASVKETYKCSGLTSKKERIRCRIRLDKENEYNYLPEECRAQSGNERINCTKAYKSVEKCWEFEKDQRRFECARNEFALRNIADERAECEALGDNKSACLRNFREKVDRAVKFRIYNLEEKAERLMGKGKANESELVDLVEQLEQKKLDYNKARTKEAKKIVLQDVRELWKAFVDKIKAREKAE